MDQRREVCGEAPRSRSGCSTSSAQLVERAKADGKLRADTEPWDVPGLICGIGRAVRARPGRRR